MNFVQFEIRFIRINYLIKTFSFTQVIAASLELFTKSRQGVLLLDSLLFPQLELAIREAHQGNSDVNFRSVIGALPKVNIQP